MAAVLARLPRGEIVTRATLADLPAIVALLVDDPLGRTREVPPTTTGADGAPTTSVAPAYTSAFAAIDADPAQLLVAVRAADANQGDHATQADWQQLQLQPIVGTMQLSFIPGLSHGGMLRAQIEAVRVAEGYRGQGLGRDMFVWAIAYARERGAGMVQLTTDKARPRARAFYERLGFVPSHEGMKLKF